MAIKGTERSPFRFYRTTGRRNGRADVESRQDAGRRSNIYPEVCTMKLSARNVLKGKVKAVNHGAVNSEVVIELAGGDEVVAVITKASAESLGLTAGKDAYAVIKATNVMVGVDH